MNKHPISGAYGKMRQEEAVRISAISSINEELKSQVVGEYMGIPIILQSNLTFCDRILVMTPDAFAKLKQENDSNTCAQKVVGELTRISQQAELDD